MCVIDAVSSDYRLSPALAARMLGAMLALAGLLVVLVTVLIASLGLPLGILYAVVALALVTVLGAAFVLTRDAYVVRLGEHGYRVRFIRGAGVKQARWKDVDDAVTTTLHGSPCVVLRLRNGGTTTIPVDALAGDREHFVRDIQEHLQRGQGLRRL